MGSSVACGSKRRNDGTVKHAVIASDASRGIVRTRNSKLADFAGEKRRAQASNLFAHAATAIERHTYTRRNISSDTARPRSMYISASPAFEALAACVPQRRELRKREKR